VAEDVIENAGDVLADLAFPPPQTRQARCRDTEDQGPTPGYRGYEISIPFLSLG
jgi:hypothetical protein